MNRLIKPLLMLAALLSLAAAHPAQASGVVTTCTRDGLQAALATGSTITFACSSPVIPITTPLHITAPDTTLDGGGVIVLDGGGSSQIIRHEVTTAASTTLTLKNITLQNGRASGADHASDGGAIWSVFKGGPGRPILNLDNVTFRNNVSTLTTFTGGNAYEFGGGAVYSHSGAVNVRSSRFTGNTTGGGGGAIHILQSDLTIADSTFDGNRAVGFPAGHNQGGAIYIDVTYSHGNVRITGSTFSNNETYDEGGAVAFHLYQGADTLMVDRSTFTGNRVTNGTMALGGAIAGGTGTVVITNSYFSGNSVSRPNGDGSGGAVAIAEPSAITIANSTFVDNHANGNGGGANGGAVFIANNLVPFRIVNSTIARNEAGWTGGGIFTTPNGTLSNTILAHNGGNPWNIQHNCNFRLAGGNNLQYPGTPANDPNNPPCSSGILVADPLVDAAKIDFGSTPTLALLPGSPAIDAGDNAVCAAAPVNNLDQRGLPRPADGDSDGTPVCDIGAYESQNGGSVPIRNFYSAPPTLTWSGVTWATGYQVQVDDGASFGAPYFDRELPAGMLWTSTDGLSPNILYYWRVRARKQDGTWGAWSVVDTFVIES